MRLGYLGPEGTFSEQALLASPRAGAGEHVALGTIHDTIMAVQDGVVDRALVPIENALEGAVRPTLDALAGDARDVVIVGEAVLAIRTCLIAAPGDGGGRRRRRAVAPTAARAVRGLPAPHAPARRGPGRDVDRRGGAQRRRARGPLGGARAAARRGALRLHACWRRASTTTPTTRRASSGWLAPGTPPDAGDGPWKTSLVFSGAGDAAPGWLVRCLSEFAFRGVNLTRIESRPLRARLGHYLFHVDCDGASDAAPVAGAIEALRPHCDQIRLLGSYPAA